MRMLPALLFTIPLAGQSVWTVNSAGGAQFTTVQMAIAAATPGDRIEVLGGGPYPAFVVDKGVDVEALAGAVCASFEVALVPAGQTARVTGFAIDRFNSGFVRVRDCPGAVLLAALAPYGAPQSMGLDPGLAITNCPNVFVRDSSFTGNGGYGTFTPGIHIGQSRVVLVRTTAVGGHGLLYTSGVGTSGGAGVSIANSHVTLVGVSASGGPATSGSFVGGNGGHGIEVVAGTALVLGATNLRGAPGGSTSPWPGSAGFAALGNVRFTPDTLLIGSTSAATPIAARPIVTSPSTVSIGTTLVVGVQGVANQLVWLGIDLRHDYAELSPWDSSLSLTSTTVLLPSLTLGVAGSGTLLVTIPNLPALRHLDLFVQAAAIGAASPVLGAPSSSRIQ